MMKLAVLACVLAVAVARPQVTPNLAVPGGDVIFHIQKSIVQSQSDTAQPIAAGIGTPGFAAHQAAEAAIYAAQGRHGTTAHTGAEARVIQAQQALIAAQQQQAAALLA